MTAPDQVIAASERAAKRNEGGRHSTPKGYKHHDAPPPTERERHVPSAARPPSPRATAELARLGGAAPPLPPGTYEMEGAEEEKGK